MPHVCLTWVSRTIYGFATWSISCACSHPKDAQTLGPGKFKESQQSGTANSCSMLFLSSGICMVQYVGSLTFQKGLGVGGKATGHKIFRCMQVCPINNFARHPSSMGKSSRSLFRTSVCSLRSGLPGIQWKSCPLGSLHFIVSPFLEVNERSKLYSTFQQSFSRKGEKS